HIAFDHRLWCMQQHDESEAVEIDPVLLPLVDPHRDRGLAITFSGARGQVGADAGTYEAAIAGLEILSFNAPVCHARPPLREACALQSHWSLRSAAKCCA